MYGDGGAEELVYLHFLETATANDGDVDFRECRKIVAELCLGPCAAKWMYIRS